MFGYVKPEVASLRVREYELYRAVYCGLCRTMGDVSGQLSRLTLRYDLTFLALVRLAVWEDAPTFARHRCAVHPLKPRLMAEDHPVLRYTAACAAMLTEAKIRDDLADEVRLSRLKPALASPFAGHMVHLARKKEPEPLSLSPHIHTCLTELGRLEKEKCDSPDKMASLFGTMLGELFAHGITGSMGTVVRNIGYSTGRFLYLCDAFDDLPEDIRLGRYNPLALLWGEMALDESGKPAAPVQNGFLTGGLIDLEKAGLAAELLPESPFGEIIKNILYLGMRDMLHKLADGNKGTDKARLSQMQTIYGS